ncbi:MAG: zinc ribbon domain-containing protein [Thermoplasmata archaeon]
MAKKRGKVVDSCPFCQTPYSGGAAFCAHCGRPRGSESLLPPPSPAPVAVVAPSPFSVPPPPPPNESIGPGGVDAWTRPPFPEEQQALRRYGSSPAVQVGRFVGLLCGAGSAMLGVEAFLGFSFDPVIYPTLVVILAIIAVAAGGTARALRKRATSALKAGQVMEAEGPAQWGPGIQGGRIQLQLAGVRMAVPRKWAAGLQSTPMLRAAWVLAGRAQRLPGTGRVQPVVLVSANGSPLLRPQLGFLGL